MLKATTFCSAKRFGTVDDRSQKTTPLQEWSSSRINTSRQTGFPIDSVHCQPLPQFEDVDDLLFWARKEHAEESDARKKVVSQHSRLSTQANSDTGAPEAHNARLRKVILGGQEFLKQHRHGAMMVHGLFLTGKLLDNFGSCGLYSVMPFMLLRVTSVLPDNVVVFVEGESQAEFQARFNAKITTIMVVSFDNPPRMAVRHWMLIHVDLEGKLMTCYDSLTHEDSTGDLEAHRSAYARTNGLVGKAFVSILKVDAPRTVEAPKVYLLCMDLK